MNTFIIVLIVLVILVVIYFLLKKKTPPVTTTTTKPPLPTTTDLPTTTVIVNNIYYVNNFGDTCDAVGSIPWYGADIIGKPASINCVFKLYDNPSLTGNFLDPGESYSTIGWSDIDSDISAKYFGDINDNGEIGSVSLCINTTTDVPTTTHFLTTTKLPTTTYTPTLYYYYVDVWNCPSCSFNISRQIRTTEPLIQSTWYLSQDMFDDTIYSIYVKNTTSENNRDFTIILKGGLDCADTCLDSVNSI